jgi:putative transposase
MIKAYKYRIYPNKLQRRQIEATFGCNRWVYNWGLETKIKAYEQTGKSPGCNNLIKQLPILKKQPETAWLADVSSVSLQQSLRHLDNAYTAFFRRHNSFPKFKSKHNGYQSYTELNAYVKENKIVIPKVGKVKTAFSRDFTGEIHSSTISKTPTGKYFVSILVEDNLLALPKQLIVDAIGIDLGIRDYAILSTGEKIANPKHLRQGEQKLAKLQKRLAKKQKGSSRRKIAKLKVAKQHEKITNQRKDFQHKLSTRLIVENQYIALEDLAVSNMVKNHKLAKSISDAGWSAFVDMLVYKAEWYGVTVKRIGRFEPSSKMCSCGETNRTLTLQDREWTCKVCNTTHDRDILAAQNILKFSGYVPC